MREFRVQLRLERERRRRDEVEGAVRARTRATSLLGELTQRLERRFVRYSRAAFGDDAELVEEGIAEMFKEFCRRARDLSPANAMLEQPGKFNFVVKKLIIDAIGAVRRHNGMTEDGRPATQHRGSAKDPDADRQRFNVLSLEKANERAAGAAAGERLARPVEVIDPAASEAFVDVEESDLRRRLGATALGWIEQLPPRQRLIVQARYLREPPMTWEQVAECTGLSARMAQLDLAAALAALRRRYAEQGPGTAVHDR